MIIYYILFIILGGALFYMLNNKLAIFFPTTKSMMKIILDFADVKKTDIVYDLGSGDGRVLIEFAKKGVKTVGIEKNPILNWLAKIRIKKSKFGKKIKIIKDDFFNQNISEATIIIAYLSRIVTFKLQKKIEKEVKKGTKIIIVDHHFKNWKPIKIKTVQLIPIRLYIK